MEQAEFWGIVFRSESHMQWFQMSMILLGCDMFFLLLGLAVRSLSFLAVGLSLVFFYMHFFTSLIAGGRALVLIFIFKENPNGPVFSVDCIWFNALMAAIHICIFLVALSIFNKENAISLLKRKLQQR